METNKELMRAEFEAAYGPKEGFAWLNPDNTYKSQAIQDGWEIWQKAWQARAALSQRREAVDDSLPIPHTLGAFTGSFYYQHKRQPTQQEVFDAGMRSGRDLYSPRPAPSAAAGEQPFPFAWPHAQRIVEAEQFLKAYSDTNMEKLLGDYQVQPIIRKLAAMIGQWQQAAAYAMSADNCAAQPTPAQGDAVPVANIVPGKMRCAKCDFSLLRTTLNVATGSAYAGDNKTEPCPNGCGPLWPMTWEQEAREGYKLCEQLFDRAKVAEDALATRQSSADAVDASLLSALRVAKGCIQHYQYGGSSFKKQADAAIEFIDAAIAAQGGKGENA